jgi:hypothetical protein
MRGSRLILNMTPSVDSLAVSNSALRFSASAYIERNLISSNCVSPRPARTWRNRTGPRELTLIAIATAISSGLSRISSSSEMPTSSPRLAIREAWGRGADREQRQAADLVQRLRSVEQLEQPRHHVDCDAVVAAGADAAEQLLMAGAGEGDDDPIDFELIEHLIELIEGAQLREALSAIGAVNVVVDEPDRLQAELGMALEPVGEPVGDDPGADDDGPLAQRHDAVSPASGKRAGDASEGSRRRRRDERDQGRPLQIQGGGGAEDRPGENDGRDQRPGGVGEAARPGEEVAVAVEAEDEGERDRADDQNRDQGGCRGDGDGKDQRGDGPCQASRNEVCPEQEAVEKDRAPAGSGR